MTAATGGLDLLVLTGGVGEHAWQVRAGLAGALAAPGGRAGRRASTARRPGTATSARPAPPCGPSSSPPGRTWRSAGRSSTSSAARTRSAGPAAAVATSAAQARMASQSRKSPSGARMAVTMARSPKLSRLLSSRPGNTWCPRAPISWLSGWTSCGSSGGKGGDPIGPLENSHTGRVAQLGGVRAQPSPARSPATGRRRPRCRRRRRRSRPGTGRAPPPGGRRSAAGPRRCRRRPARGPPPRRSPWWSRAWSRRRRSTRAAVSRSGRRHAPTVADVRPAPARCRRTSAEESSCRRLVLAFLLEPVGLLLGLVHGLVGVLRRAVDRVQDQRVRAGVDEVVLLPGRDDDQVALRHVLLRPRHDRLPGAADERQDLVDASWTSSPISPPGGMVMMTSWVCSPVHSTRRKSGSSRLRSRSCSG